MFCGATVILRVRPPGPEAVLAVAFTEGMGRGTAGWKEGWGEATALKLALPRVQPSLRE